jgi:hypothetical protein
MNNNKEKNKTQHTLFNEKRKTAHSDIPHKRAKGAKRNKKLEHPIPTKKGTQKWEEQNTLEKMTYHTPEGVFEPTTHYKLKKSKHEWNHIRIDGTTVLCELCLFGESPST